VSLRTLRLAALALVVPSLLAAQVTHPLAARIDSLFADYGAGTPGAAVAVVQHGEVLYEQSYGMADLEHEIPITSATVFDIASFSKQFAGMAIAMLVEKGGVSLDENIRTYIPEVPDFGTPITVRHLVHHISGIRDWPATLGIAGWQMDDVISFQQIMTMVWHQQDLNFPPGAEYSYSNTGYNLLAEIVARVSGMSFRAWTDTNIFEPLGMENTHFHDDHQEVVPNRAYGYSSAEDGYRVAHNGLTAFGSSSLFTTIADLTKWAANFDDPKVGGVAVIERMHERGKLNIGRPVHYAFGLAFEEYRGLSTSSHGGSWANFRTHFLRFPDQGFTVMVLGNSASFNPSSRCYRIADMYLADVMAPQATSTSSADRPEVTVDGLLLDEYVGTYKLGPGWLVTVTRSGNRLMTQATEEPAFPMKAVSDREFWVADYGASIAFMRNRATNDVSWIQYRGMQAPRVQLFEPSVEQLGEYVGRYYSEELGAAYDVVLEGDRLFALHRRHGEITLLPTVKDEFRAGRWFLRAVTFVRDPDGAVTGMRVGVGRARNLKFERKGLEGS